MADTNKNAVSAKPSTSNPTNVIVLTPEECTKLGLFKQVQVAIKNSPSTSQTTLPQSTVRKESKSRDKIKNSPSTSQTTVSQSTVTKEPKSRETKPGLDEFGKMLTSAMQKKLSRIDMELKSNSSNVTQLSQRETLDSSKFMQGKTLQDCVTKSSSTQKKIVHSSDIITLDDDNKDISHPNIKETPLKPRSSSSETVIKQHTRPVNDHLSQLKKERVNVISSTSLNLSSNEIKNLLSLNKPKNITHQPFIIPKEEIVLEDDDLTSSTTNIVSNCNINQEEVDLAPNIKETKQVQNISQTGKPLINADGDKNRKKSVHDVTDIEIVSFEENQDEVVVVLNTNNRFDGCKREGHKDDLHSESNTSNVNIIKGPKSFGDEDADIIEIKMNNKKGTDVQISREKMRENVKKILNSQNPKRRRNVKKSTEVISTQVEVESHVNKVNTFKCYGKNNTIIKSDPDPPVETTPKKRSNRRPKPNANCVKKLKRKENTVQVVAIDLTEEPENQEVSTLEVKKSKNIQAEIAATEHKISESTAFAGNEHQDKGKDDNSSIAALIPRSDIDSEHTKLENSALNEKELTENIKKDQDSVIALDPSFEMDTKRKELENNALNKEELIKNTKEDKSSVTALVQNAEIEAIHEARESNTLRDMHMKSSNKEKPLETAAQVLSTEIDITDKELESNGLKKESLIQTSNEDHALVLSSRSHCDVLTYQVKDVAETHNSSIDITDKDEESSGLKQEELKQNSNEDYSLVRSSEYHCDVLTYEVKDVDETAKDVFPDSKISTIEPDWDDEPLISLNTKQEHKTEGEPEIKKKKRWRPKKNLSVTADSYIIEPKELHISSNTSNNLNVKRNRKSINYNENKDKELDDLIERKGIVASLGNQHSDGSLKLTPSKVGRPRKSAQIPNVKEQKDDLSTITTPRKRGRPRKSFLPPAANEDSISKKYSSESESELQIESSIHGRKRKKVNYMRMENPEKEKRRRKSSLFDSNVSEGGCSDASPNDQEKAEISSNVSDGKEDHKTKDTNRGYRANRATTKMLSTILSTSLGTDDVDIGAGPKVTLGAGQRWGLKTDGLSNNKPKINYNPDGTVVCMICNQNINDEEWQYHKMKIHYNLAWRSGESPLDIHDSDFVFKNLMKFKNHNGKLKCHKCGTKGKDVRKFMDHLDLCNGIVSSDGCVTCAVCGEVLQKSQWQFHKLRYHNNLTWRQGEKPLNLSDQNLVMAILNSIYKTRKPLHCEKCDVPKKSVIGYLSHKSICQRSVEELELLKVACDLCGARMLPVSVESHKKQVHSNKKSEAVLESQYFNVDSVTAGGRRKAAKKALDIIDVYKTNGRHSVQVHNKYYVPQIDFKEEIFVRPILKAQLDQGVIKCKFKNCDYTDPSVKDLIEHMSECKHKPSEYYCCRRCLTINETEVEMKEHFMKYHDVTVKFDEDFVASDVDEAEDEEQEYNENILKHKMTHQMERREKDASYKITPRCIIQIVRRDTKKIFESAYIWTKQFCDEHYLKIKLFDKLLGIDQNWQILDDELLDSYLPPIHRSCDVGDKVIKEKDNLENMEYTFRRFELFESATNSNGSRTTLFSGGPISSMAWLPTPHTQLNCDQVLAVSVLNNSQQHYNIYDNYPGPSMIQFWNFGSLRNRDKLGLESTSPKLMFGLAHNYGPVWHMEWCPSGCYNSVEAVNSKGTLGLLAVACSVPAVPLFAVNRISEDGLFYKAKPVLELELESDFNITKQKYYPTRISWSKASGHQYIAVGYTNGIVAIYDTTRESILLRNDKEGQRKLSPYKLFQAHVSYITALSLSHLDGGNRWLMTASFDRDSIIWDLINLTKVSRSVKKFLATDGVWMHHWLNGIFSQCESSCGLLDNVPTHLNFVRNFLSEPTHLLATMSTIKCLSASEWLNAIIQTTSSGDVVAQFPHQLLTKVAGDKSLRYTRRLFGKTKLVEKPAFKKELQETTSRNTELQTKAVTYEEAVEKYSLLLLDYDMDQDGHLPKSINMGEFSGNGGKLEFLKHDEYPLQSINKVAFNPNLQSSTYFATGYEAGFVRITHMRYLKNNHQIV